MADVLTSKPGSGREGSPTKRVTMTTPQSPGRLSITPGSGKQTQTGSDYMKPVVRSAVRRWKRLHEQNMMEKLVGMRNEKKNNTRSSRDDARKMARKIPTEILAKQWLNDNEATLEVRSYLVDKVLPTLILGVEKLLTEADKKGLTEENEEDPDFNPINFLAQYLLRNNPKYSNFSEASPYVRGLREVADGLRKQLFNIEDNRLARIKTEAKRRREEREKLEQIKQKERERRENCFMDQFREWNSHPEGKVELSLVQNALRSFSEIAEATFPEELRDAAKLSRSLEATDESGKCLTVKDFAKYLSGYVEDLTRDLFDEFMKHLAKCAISYRAATQEENRRIALSNLFISCDHSGIGLLDRHRILSLFENFWDTVKDNIKMHMRNPRRWPVVEVDEVEDTYNDDEDIKPVEETEQKSEMPAPSKETTTVSESPEDISVSREQSKESIHSETTNQLGSVKFAEGTTFDRERTVMTARSQQSGTSAFDENVLNVSQFVQLTETFLNKDEKPKQEAFVMLAKFIKEGYEETEEEKMDRLIKARKEALSSQRKHMMDQLFEKWDNDGSGFLDLEDVEGIMVRYKDGQENEAINKAKTRLKKTTKYAQDNRLSKREFRTFVQAVTDEISGADSFDYYIDFLTNSVERTYAERIRGEARKKWLQQVVSAAETSGASMEPVYKSVFQALYKDSEAHGNGKKISSNIAMLERNRFDQERGEVCLRYVAATIDDADFLLGKILYKDMKGISFASVERGQPIHVPRVANHGNVQFWNPYRLPEDREGSFIVVPLKDKRKRVFGLIGVDTLNDRHSKTIFITHEIQYFQGVAKAFSIAYHHIDMRKKLLRITESAVSWIHRRNPHVHEISTYMVEPDGKEKQDYVLRKMMNTDAKGNVQNLINPPRLERKDNLFRDYLFKTVDTSESISADAYGERHLAFPLRDDNGKAIAVVDISIGETKILPTHENKEVQRMLRLLQQAHKEITREFAGDDKNIVLEAERDDENRMDIMFDRLMLMELRENVSKIDAKAFAELRSYNDPPKIVVKIVKAVSAIFFLEKVQNGELDDWTNLRTYMNNDLLQKIAQYDPTAAEDHQLIPPEKIEVHLKDVPHGEVSKFGSVPAQHMYNWVFVCISLIEHTLKMRENDNSSVLK
ncbi:EF-hand calcium-binding domain-containing protein 5-like isoform X2 [Mytilus galloprovincialis]|uniref:EF-hand calcium-binding domain-containing protein 5-like isoform X2 n=1 Tax=Mytilus galloprovincialis TaxID=29158 RepID=UPI003F7BD9A4